MSNKPKLVISDRELSPTVVFDTFWRFVCERREIELKRINGDPAPWTDDAILQKYRFTNVSRVSDRVSQYLIVNVIETGSQDIEEQVSCDADATALT